MEDISELYKEGNSLFKEKKYREAIECYKKCLDINSGCTYIFLEIARAYFMRKDYDNALENFSNYIDYSSYNDINIYPYISYCLYKKKDYIGALEAFGYTEESSDITSPHQIPLVKLDELLDDGYTYMARVHVGLADEYLKESKYASALELYQEAIEIDPEIENEYKEEINKLKIIVNTLNKADDYFEKGNNAYDNEEYSKAVEYYETSLEFNPDNDLAYLNNADAYYELEEYNSALEYYNKYIEKTENIEDYVYFKIAYCNDELENYDKAFEYYNKAIELDNENAVAYNNRALNYQDRKEYKLALEDFNKAIELDSEEILYRKNRVDLFIEIKDYNSALDDYLYLMDIKDYDEPDKYLKGVDKCFKNGADIEKVIECYEKYFHYYKETRINILKNYVDLYKKMKKYNDAIEKYTQFINDFEDNIEFYIERANLFFYYLKDYQKALDDFNIIMDYYQNKDLIISEIHLKRGECYKELGAFDLAIADLTIGIQCHNQARNYRLRAQAYENINDIASAIADYEKVIELTSSEKEKTDCKNRINDLRNIKTKNICIENCSMAEILSIEGINSSKANKFFKLRKEKTWYKLENFAKDLGLFNPQFMTSKDAKRLIFPAKPMVEYGKRKIDF